MHHKQLGKQLPEVKKTAVWGACGGRAGGAGGAGGGEQEEGEAAHISRLLADTLGRRRGRTQPVFSPAVQTPGCSARVLRVFRACSGDRWFLEEALLWGPWGLLCSRRPSVRGGGVGVTVGPGGG